MLLGIDVGTTGTKSVLVREDGTICHSSYQGYGLISPMPSHVEQNPEDWWNAVKYTVRECAANVPAGEKITALCASVQSGTVVPVDAQLRPVGNAISWLDTRATDTYRWLIEQKGEEYFYRKTGWRLNSCFNFVQICHMRRENPELYNRAAYFMSVADFLTHRLTGRFVIDNNSIWNAQLSNVETGEWDDDILALAGIDRSRVAELVPCASVVGNLTREAADALGLDTDVKVVSGAQDQYCSTVGIGALHDGDVMFSTGTSWVVLGVSKKIVYDTKNYLTLGGHVVPDLYSSFAYTPAGGAGLKWFRDCMGKPSGAGTGVESYDEITSRAAKIKPGADGLFFLPHLGGTLFPTWEAHSRGTLWGMDFAHNHDHVARAILEGISFDLLWMIRGMQEAGYNPRVLKSLGGSTRSNVWMQMVSDMTGMEMQVSDFPDMAPMGAAMMASVATGIYRDFAEARQAFNVPTRGFEPNMAVHDVYQDIFERYKELFFLQRDAYQKFTR